MTRLTTKSLADAARIAGMIVARLVPQCDRIEVAGSIRRGRSVVGDVEIILVPSDPGTFGDFVLSLCERPSSLFAAQNEPIFGWPTKNGPRYKRLEVLGKGIALDLFVTTPDRWGVLLAIRTGPVDYSAALVRPRSKRGLLPEGMSVADGLLFDREGASIPTYEERDFLKIAGGWIDPCDREFFRRNPPERRAAS